MNYSELLKIIAVVASLTHHFAYTQNVQDAFIKNEIVPDVVPAPPTSLANVCFPSGVQASLGNELTPTQVKDQPSVSWDADPNSWYTLIMADPDAPSRANPIKREWIHWLVVNIPGSDVSAGDAIVEFVSSSPPQCSGLHRYVYLIYKQPGKEQFNETRINNRNPNRGSFHANVFAVKYNLCSPVAGNFYLAQYDDYVPTVKATLTGTR